MQYKSPITLPERVPAKDTSINVRLSHQDRAEIESLAKQLGVNVSHLIRDFLKQAMEYAHNALTEHAGEGGAA
ncbi:MAG: hypothetical protein IT322_14580 [Anaerolineae bacterium]|nr:hypothetical protein [Anaerolineae bacterium]